MEISPLIGNGTKLKVLAVDDSAAILDLIKEILQVHKFEVETAENGALALHKYASFQPDIVTLDVAMPVMDGYETLRRLLAIDKDANVIMLTANEQQRMVENCLERGAIGYIGKPFTAKELVSMINISLKAGSDKNVAVLFHRVGRKIQASLKKLLPAQEVTVTLSQVSIIRPQATTQIFSANRDLAQIRVVPNLSKGLQVEAPANTFGYATEFGGQQSGRIISFAGKENLLNAVGRPKTTADYDNAQDKITEFFNIFNQNIITELADSTHMILTPEPTMPHNKSAHGNFGADEMTKVKFDISIDQMKSTIEVQAWFNASMAFRR